MRSGLALAVGFLLVAGCVQSGPKGDGAPSAPDSVSTVPSSIATPAPKELNLSLAARSEDPAAIELTFSGGTIASSLYLSWKCPTVTADSLPLGLTVAYFNTTNGQNNRTPEFHSTGFVEGNWNLNASGVNFSSGAIREKIEPHGPSVRVEMPWYKGTLNGSRTILYIPWCRPQSIVAMLNITGVGANASIRMRPYEALGPQALNPQSYADSPFLTTWSQLSKSSESAESHLVVFAFAVGGGTLVERPNTAIHLNKTRVWEGVQPLNVPTYHRVAPGHLDFTASATTYVGARMIFGLLRVDA